MADDFFSELKSFDDFADVADDAAYVNAPSDWNVVITDVQGSTKAIEAGRYKEVNALGVASIVAIQNACKGVALPYTFGGDGATILTPAKLEPEVRRALRGIRARAGDFDMEMRGGLVPVNALESAGHQVRVARFQPTENVSFAMFKGSGIAEAEVWVKDPNGDRFRELGVDNDGASFEGFECRWAPVMPRKDEIISLLVLAFGDELERAAIYREVVGIVEGIVPEGRPVAAENMHLQTDRKNFAIEAKLRTRSAGGVRYRLALRTIAIQTRIGAQAMKNGDTRFGFDGAKYFQEVLLQTDYRKFDETLRMVLDVRQSERDELEAKLDVLMKAGKIVYGVHRSQSALVTCKVADRGGDHVHFVDGADGGYAMAAKVLKGHIKKRG